MNRSKTAIIADSGCDVPMSFREKYDIRLLPFHIIYPEKDYLDSVDIDPLMIYRRFPDEFPSTSTPSIADVDDVIDKALQDGYERAIIFCISHGFSGSYNAARLAASERDDIKIFVFDTFKVSLSAGLYAIWAAEKLAEGWSYDQVVEKLPSMIPDGNIFFYMDTLQYLQRGGRIGKLAGSVGSLLKLKPIITCDETGVYTKAGLIRGERLGKKKLMEVIQNFAKGSKSWVLVGEGNAHLEALEFESMLKQNLPDAKFLGRKQITASLALNSGPGLIGVGILKNP
ncbi:MAG: DegV family protein [Lachnospiraceae bacterium]|jgi:DegV family protein with EDD domain